MQKINGLFLETYGMILAKFSIQNSLGKLKFFEETFLLINTSIKVILGMVFFFFNNTDVKFAKKTREVYLKILHCYKSPIYH